MNLEMQIFLEIYRTLWSKGQIVSPRGLKIKEIENMHYTLPPYVRFSNFNSRKLSLRYIKKEFLWYLKGNRYDKSIIEEAAIWKDLINTDGGINSNYGQYINKQFDNVIKILANDKDSRRASIIILTSDHLLSDTKDYPCTYALNFRIRNNLLKMTVHMRSQDAIFGMGNDAPVFSFFQEMIYITLKSFYPTLEMGEYFHFADSFHIYEKHFKMIEKILKNSEELPNNEYIPIQCPKISSIDEVEYLRKINFVDKKEKNKEKLSTYNFINWLNYV